MRIIQAQHKVDLGIDELDLEGELAVFVWEDRGAKLKDIFWLTKEQATEVALELLKAAGVTKTGQQWLDEQKSVID